MPYASLTQSFHIRESVNRDGIIIILSVIDSIACKISLYTKCVFFYAKPSLRLEINDEPTTNRFLTLL